MSGIVNKVGSRSGKVWDGLSRAAIADLPAVGADGNTLTSDGTNWASEAAAAAGSSTAVAEGSLADGSLVILRGDGKVEIIDNAGTSLDTPVTDNDGFVQPKNMWFNGQYTVAQGGGVPDPPEQKVYMDWDPFSENKFIMAYSQSGGSTWMNQKYVIGTINEFHQITFNSSQSIDSVNGASPTVVKWSPNTQDLIACAYGGGINPFIKFGKVNGSNTIDWGSTTNLHMGGSYGSSTPDFSMGAFEFDWDLKSSSNHFPNGGGWLSR